MTPLPSSSCSVACTAKTLYEKFETNIPKKGIARPQSQFPHSCVCELFIYCIPTIGLPILLQEICGPIPWEYIRLWQTHECGNWDWGRAIPFLGIHKRDFHCSVRFRTVNSRLSAWYYVSLCCIIPVGDLINTNSLPSVPSSRKWLEKRVEKVQQCIEPIRITNVEPL